MHRRVAITGIGVVSALGNGREAFWDGLVGGRAGIGPIASVANPGVKFVNGAEAREFRPEDHASAKDAALLDRFAILGLAAAREAAGDAGLALTDSSRETCAVVTGSAMGGQASEESGYYDLWARHQTRFPPFSIPRSMMNAAASRIALEYGITGPVFTLSTACASASHALGHAMWLVRSGAAEMAIAGGSEAPFTLGSLKAWDALRVVSPDTCRPFSRDRRGMILGEGAAMMVLEPLDAALARGANVYGELAGFGMSADAHHITQPLAEGAARAMRAALRDAGLTPEAVGYVNAHGTGTAANDATESEAIRQVFGSAPPLVSSTKSMHGHALGASGALEAAAAALALRRGVLPPTANFTEADPDCGLDVIPNAARERTVDAALSNSFAFGGLNAVLAFRRV